MCLTTIKTFPLSSDEKKDVYDTDINKYAEIAKEDIIVYKVLRLKSKFWPALSGLSPFQDFKYIISKTYTSKFILGDYSRPYDIYDTPEYHLKIENGLHAYVNSSNVFMNRTLSSSKPHKVFEMIIPKGSKYFVGTRHDIVSDTLIWPSKFYFLKQKIKNILKIS